MLSVAQTELNRAGLMLVSASKVGGNQKGSGPSFSHVPIESVVRLMHNNILQAFLQNPKIKAAEENREVIIEGMLRSLKTLSLLASGDDPFATEKSQTAARFQPGELGASFESLEVSG